MHERLSSLEKQMQDALDFQADDITERDARNLRILYRYLLLSAGEKSSHGESEDKGTCLVYSITGPMDQECLITDICSITSKTKDRNKRKPPRSVDSQWICCFR